MLHLTVPRPRLALAFTGAALVAVLALVLFVRPVEAATETAATGGGAISVDTAATATTPAWTTLTGPMVITEALATDIAVEGPVTMIFTAPAGFEFNTAILVDVAKTGADITSVVTPATVAATTITITYTAGATATNNDTITIGSSVPIQVRPTGGTPATGNITRTGGSGTAIPGITGATNFGTLTSVVGVASQLAVTTEPSASTVAGVAFAQQPVVTVQDQFGNTVTGDTSTVTLALTTGTGTLSGTATKAAVAGVADFTANGLSIDLVGANKVLTATDGGLTLATTAAFTITPAAASKLAVTTEPTASTVAGVAIAQQPIVTIQDAFGNTDTSDNTTVVTLALTTGDGTLSGTATETAVAGVADFAANGLSIELVGADKVLTATGGGFTLANTAAFTITHAAAAKLALITPPSASSAPNVAFAQQPLVKIQDAFNNTVTSDSTTVVTAALTTGTGTLGGTVTKTAASGVADFAANGLAIDLTGTDKVLTFTSAPVFTLAVSAAFTIAAPVVPPPAAPTPQPTVEADGISVPVENVISSPASAVDETVLSTVAADGSAATVTVPAAALPDGSTIEVGAVTDVAELAAQTAPPAGVDLVLGFSITAADADGGAVTSDFSSPVTLEFVVDASSLPSGAGSAELRIAFWNGTAWVPLDSAVTINADGSATISAATDHFSLYSVVYDSAGFGRISGQVPTTGVGLVTFGGSVAELQTAMVAAGCSKPAFTTDGGVWVG